jgi:predicted HNH restriction endonuclease
MIRGYRKCESCGITEWLGQEVFLQVHHINGEHNDNRLENLMMICPNCHALTSSYCVSKAKRKNNI